MLFRSGAALVTSRVEVPPLPDVLANEMSRLEKWVESNEKDFKHAQKMFWVLKAPIICVTASTSVFASFGLKTEGIIAGGIAAVLISVESKNPYAIIRTNCDLAIHELRQLEQEIVSRWNSGYLNGKEPKSLTAEIIVHVEKEGKRINDYLKPSGSKSRNASEH